MAWYNPLTWFDDDDEAQLAQNVANQQYGQQLKQAKFGAGPGKDLFAESALRRQQAIAAKKGLAQQAGAYATQLGAAQQKASGRMKGAYQKFQGGVEGGRGAIRSQAAEALAAGQAHSGGYGTAGGYGAALQAGKQAGAGLGAYEADVAGKQAGYEQQLAALELANVQQLGSAQQAAKEAELAALEYEEEAGDVAKDRQAKQADLESRIRDIANGATGLVFDDPQKAYAEILKLAEFEPDPELRAYVEQRAAEVRDELEQWL